MYKIHNDPITLVFLEAHFQNNRSVLTNEHYKKANEVALMHWTRMSNNQNKD